MKKVTVSVIMCFLLSIPSLAICGLNSGPDGWTGNVNVFLGAKALDEDEWEPTEEQSEFGLELDFKQQSWPVSVAIDVLRGSGDGTHLGIKFESETSEFNIGVRKIWDQYPQVRPFIGGGISFIRGEFSGWGFLMMIVPWVFGLGEVYTGHWLNTSTLD